MIDMTAYYRLAIVRSLKSNPRLTSLEIAVDLELDFAEVEAVVETLDRKHLDREILKIYGFLA